MGSTCGMIRDQKNQCIAPSLTGTGIAVLLAVPSPPTFLCLNSDFLHVLKYCFRCNENQCKTNFFYGIQSILIFRKMKFSAVSAEGAQRLQSSRLTAHELLQTPPQVVQGLVTGCWVLSHLPQLLLSGSVNWASGPWASRSAHVYVCRYRLLGRGVLLVTFQRPWPLNASLPCSRSRELEKCCSLGVQVRCGLWPEAGEPVSLCRWVWNCLFLCHQLWSCWANQLSNHLCPKLDWNWKWAGRCYSFDPPVHESIQSKSKHLFVSHQKS